MVLRRAVGPAGGTDERPLETVMPSTVKLPTTPTASHAAAVSAMPAAVAQRLQDMGVTPIGSTPSELADQIRADMERWGPLIKEAGISARD